MRTDRFLTNCVGRGRYIGLGDDCSSTLTTTTAQLDAKTNDLARTWRPDGHYTTTDLQNMIRETFAMLKSGSDAIDAAISAGVPASIRTSLRNFQGRIQSRMADSMNFTTPVNIAINSGIRVVDAPTFKDWVIKSMVATSAALGTVAYFACSKPTVVAWFQTFMTYFDRVIAFGKALLNVVVAAGETVLQVPNALAKLWTYAKWGSLAGLAYYVLIYKPKPASAS